MGIGYACLAAGVPQTEMKSLTLASVSEKTLMDTCRTNIAHLKNLITYTKGQGIELFRISSDLIPFGSSVANTLPWWEVFASELASIGVLAQEGGIRLSMHPGQYTVINSPNKSVVDNAIADLLYHARVLASLGCTPDAKIILHIGGGYGDKEAASRRFITVYRSLPHEVRQRLVIENDDKLYTIGEVLAIAEKAGCPAVFDNLHHAINPGREALTEREWMLQCASTWKPGDGRQKIHYSQQDPTKRAGSHSPSIALDEFLLFYEGLSGLSIDIMLEVKDKNISALKCMHATSGATREQLEAQWQRYRPLVHERDPAMVWEIKELLQGGGDGQSLGVAFYRLLERILAMEVSRPQAVITAETVAKQCIRTPTEGRRIDKRIAAYKRAEIPLDKLKQSILTLANNHAVDEVLTSYYFMM
ncbi:MAG: UV DNA damage repair endonuclease UvsE [Sphaerochaeta sp.]|nr:UV DNA damage repair endonuclease UvsE [Sphaerochaeta sp.]